jgi:hypothetical protein
MKEDDLVKSYVMHVSNVHCLQNFIRQDHLRDLGIDGRIMLQQMGWCGQGNEPFSSL